MKKPKPSFPPGQKLSTDAVLQRFGISRWTLHRWHKDEELGFPKPIFINRRHYFDAGEILRWEMKQAGIDPDGDIRLQGMVPVSQTITDYDELVSALTKRRSALKMTCEELDAVTGLQEGYVNKLENYHRPNGRGAGKDSLFLWTGGLRVGIILVDLPRRPRSLKRIQDSVDMASL